MHHYCTYMTQNRYSFHVYDKSFQVVFIAKQQYNVCSSNFKRIFSKAKEIFIYDL